MIKKDIEKITILFALIIVLTFLVFISLLSFIYNKYEIETTKDCIKQTHSTGNSMLPTIENISNQLVNICIQGDELRVGDIIIYFSYQNGEKIYLLHRITYIDYEEEIIITRGDNNKYYDNEFGFNRVYGRYVGNL